MIRATITELLAEGAIERVTKDPQTARQELVTAARHLATARGIRDIDPNAAFAVG